MQDDGALGRSSLGLYDLDPVLGIPVDGDSVLDIGLDSDSDILLLGIDFKGSGSSEAFEFGLVDFEFRNLVGHGEDNLCASVSVVGVGCHGHGYGCRTCDSGGLVKRDPFGFRDHCPIRACIEADSLDRTGIRNRVGG